jgi:starch synthase (maltosyl-transferring)
VLVEIAAGYARGTPNGIRMDPASALIWSPAHFTWMDTNYPACTPREGYPVEIQALWIRLLRQLQRMQRQAYRGALGALADRAEESLRKYFWLEEQGHVADLLIAPPGTSAADAIRDQSLRCNFLFAVAFGFFTGPQARRAVANAFRYLFVPGALRTLAPLAGLAAAGNQIGRRPAAEQSARAVLGPLSGKRRHAAQARLPQRHGLAWVLPTGCEALVKAWDAAPAAVAAAKACLGSMEMPRPVAGLVMTKAAWASCRKF